MRSRHHYVLLFVLPLLSLTLIPSIRVYALGGVTLSAFSGSNVNIDGANSPSEWSDARHLSFGWAWSNSSLTGGGDLWVKNNGVDLLVAVEATGKANKTQAGNTYLYTLYLLFDNDNNGVVNNYEDAKAQTLTFFSSATTQAYLDLHYNSTQGLYVNDTYENGTAAGSHSNPGGPGGFTWEFAIPMASIYPEDFSLAVDASIGFEIIYAEYYYAGPVPRLVSSGWAYWEVAISNGLPSGPSPSANGWAVIVRTNSQAPIADNTPPTINTPTIQPSSPGPNDPVTISVLVTDTGSGVKNVSVTYTTDSWKSVNITLTAAYNTTSQLATAQIPAQQYGGHVAYYVVAFDNAGNRAVNDNSGSYFSYDIPVPWYVNSWFYLGLAVALGALLFTVVYLTRRKRPASSIQTTGSR